MRRIDFILLLILGYDFIKLVNICQFLINLSHTTNLSGPGFRNCLTKEEIDNLRLKS
jgi:hypothetical protein